MVGRQVAGMDGKLSGRWYVSKGGCLKRYSDNGLQMTHILICEALGGYGSKADSWIVHGELLGRRKENLS